MKRAVTQFSFDGAVIQRYESIKIASDLTGAPKETILACCNGKNYQCNGFLWIYSEKECEIPNIIHTIFHPTISEEWGNEWRNVKGYENIYMVSNKGVVIAVPRLIKCGDTYKLYTFCKLKPMKNLNGYWCIRLSNHDKRERKLLHRIVAEAFIENPYNLPCINHKDENKSNNMVENLEWCDVPYNNTYGTKCQKAALKNKNGKLSLPILQFDINGELIKEYPSIREAERDGYDHSYIVKCCKGKAHSHKGFIWKYKII